jgi:hypothetical protein
MTTEKVNQKLVERISSFEDAVETVIAEIDQTDTSRLALQETLDSIRETLATAYGEPFTNNADEEEISENETVKKNPFGLFGEKKKYWAGFYTEDGDYHTASLKGKNKADAKRFARKGWGRIIRFDYIEEA